MSPDHQRGNEEREIDERVGVDEKHRITPTFSEDTKNIGRANVSTTRRADINSSEASGEIARRKRPKQITYRATDENKGQHEIGSGRGLTSGRLGWLLFLKP